MLRIRPILVLIVLAALVTACQGENTGEAEGGEATSPTATTSPAATAKPANDKPQVAKRLGPAPRDCTGPRPDLASFGDYGNLAGRSPVWAGFYASFDPPGQRYRIERDGPRTEYGWRVKVLWVIGPKLGGSARVKGRELGRGTSLWFEIGDQDVGPMTEAILDPAATGVAPSGAGYMDFPSYLYVPRAGCYALEVGWPGGTWRLVFGLGR